MTVNEALNTVLDRILPLDIETVDLLAGLGRVSVEPVIAAGDLPPWDNSSMDGFALRSEDTAAAPAVLRVIEEIPAGCFPRKSVGRGESSRIMTGGILPKGADAVIRVEDTETADPDQVVIRKAVPRHENVRFRGEDLRAGKVAIAKNTLIGSAEIAMAAAVGLTGFHVVQRPRVGILATGDELVNAGERPGPGQIADSNSYALFAQVAAAGGIPFRLGIARDDRADLSGKLKSSSGFDVLLVSGGVSVGKYDLVREVLAELGCKLEFWKVAMKPGHPLAFGRMNGRWVFGLPGNPVSTQVTFEEFVRPVLLKLAGHSAVFRPTLGAILEAPLTKPDDGKMHFIRGVVRREGGTFRARSTGAQGSGMISSMTKANGLLILPEKTLRLEAGETVVVQLLEKGLAGQAEPGFQG
jgi:molybdopterin molybdotransferase